MVRDISISLARAFTLGGSSQASHIPVVQYLPYGSTATFDLITITRKRHGNSDLRGIKIGPRSPALY